MKKYTKLIAGLMAMAVASVTVGCSKSEKEEGSALTYWTTLDSRVAQTTQSYNDLMMYQEMSKRTGVDVEFIHPTSGSNGSEAFQILLTDGDYPDIMEYDWTTYPGGPDQAIEDGVIISLNDYLEEYAPNYYDYMYGEKGKANNYLYRAQAISENGNIYGFHNLNIGTARGFNGLYIRKDKLDEWGLAIPETIAEWDVILEKAKAEGFEKPFVCINTCITTPQTNVNTFNTAFNVGKGFYIGDGEIKFGPFEPGYKEYVAKLAEWREKGYFDQDYVTNQRSDLEAYMTNGTSIAAYGSIGSAIGKILSAVEQQDPNSVFDLAACPYPVMNKGDVPLFQEVSAEATAPIVAISAQCSEEEIIKAMKFIDYLYSEEGSILSSFGVEGDTYTVETDENGQKHYVYTDKIYNFEEVGAHSVEAALYKFFRPGHAGLNQHPDYLDGFYQYEQQKDALEVWNKYVDTAKQHVPVLSFTVEESAEFAEIFASARPELDAGISNIILGKQSIDEYDSIIAKAKENGYDRLVEIHQVAYERYLDRLSNFN